MSKKKKNEQLVIAPTVPVLSFDQKINENFYRDNEALFREDLFKYHDVENNPKRDLCYRISYSRGHAYGMHEIAGVFEELVDLIK
jgi:hypothetical protein